MCRDSCSICGAMKRCAADFSNHDWAPRMSDPVSRTPTRLRSSVLRSLPRAMRIARLPPAVTSTRSSIGCQSLLKRALEVSKSASALGSSILATPSRRCLARSVSCTLTFDGWWPRSSTGRPGSAVVSRLVSLYHRAAARQPPLSPPARHVEKRIPSARPCRY
jgi:hypothetical protein